MRIHGYDVVALGKKTWAEIGKDKVSVYASQMAYSFFFALFPLLLFFAALLSLVADKQTVMAQFSGRIAAALPGDVATLLGRTVEKVVFSSGAPGLLSFGLLTAAWSGSSIFGALRAALNAAYDVEETRPWWKQYALQLGMLVLAGGVTVAATVILLNGEGVVGSQLELKAADGKRPATKLYQSVQSKNRFPAGGLLASFVVTEARKTDLALFSSSIRSRSRRALSASHNA